MAKMQNCDVLKINKNERDRNKIEKEYFNRSKSNLLLN